MNRCLAAALAWMLGTLGLVGLSSAAEADARPNVLIVLADDLGFSDIGCYGGEIPTPHLDSLAAGGLRFTQFYNTARCWPSRGALLTGFYAQAIRRDSIPGAGPGFGSAGKRPAWARLLPEMLRPLGYRSYHSGKWHVDGKVLAGGFDRSYVLDDHNRNFSPRQHSEDDKPLPPVAPDTKYYTTTAIADHAIKCLREHAAEHAAAPFFSFVAFTVPHFPLQAPAEDIEQHRARYQAGWDAIRAERGRRLKEMKIVLHDPPPIERDLGPPYPFKDAAKVNPGEITLPTAWSELNEKQREFQATKMAIHAAMVDRMDQEIGRILAQLKAMNALDNTLILFASDNGASAELMIRGDGHDMEAAPGSATTFLCLGPGWSSASNTPFRRHKTWVHEGGIATPLIVHWPRGIAARGELRRDVSHLIDVVPTILDIAGGKFPTEWNGIAVPPPPGLSLVPAFSKDGAIHHDELWWFHDRHRAIRAGDWKLVSAGANGPWELYDLATDRGEIKDLAATDPDRVRTLAARWEKQLAVCRAMAERE